MKKVTIRLLILASFYVLYRVFSPLEQPILNEPPKEIHDDTRLDLSLPVFARLEQNFSFVGKEFKYCSILNNSTFDGSVYIYSLGGSIAQRNPDSSWFYNLIDYRAAQVEKAIISQHSHSNKQDVKRFACYSTAIGDSHFVNISRQPLLISIDPITYFEPILPAINLKIDGKRKKFKLAFLIMVHELKGFGNLIRLLDVLDDGDAIILVHVDGKSSSEKLYLKIEDWISNRKILQNSNVHLAKFRLHNIWGHSSLVFTQLSGFWELKELADWDFVINLSNYDWPLKRNKQVYDALELGKNYIEFWSENDHMTERIYRPHLMEADDSSIFHLEDLGIINSIFPRWRYVKHHQWMIITPEYVEYLKKNLLALNFLAFMEHSYIPDETYFGTVLINSPELSHSLINQNKRYIRFSKWASHPSWLGWTDHSLFPPGEEIPSFFYIRKFNVLGNVFQEEKLMDWIGEFHYNNATKNCTIEDISVNKFCLRALASSITNDNHIIIAPVNRPYLVAAANLGCSLKSLEKNNIIFWSLDLSIHQALLSVGRLTIFLPGFPNIADKFQPGDQSYYSLLRYKPIIMRYILEAGFDLTFIDTDSIITSDFFGFLPRNVDIFFSGAYLKKDHDKLEISSSFIHFRTNNQTINFIKDLETAIEFYPSKSLEWIIAGLVQHVNVHGPDGFGIVFPDFSRALHFSNHSNYLKDLSIGILDPKNHIDWQSDLFSNQEANFENVRLIRYGKSKIVQSILKNAGLWYVSDSGKCFTK